MTYWSELMAIWEDIYSEETLTFEEYVALSPWNQEVYDQMHSDKIARIGVGTEMAG